ncbi:hypothetical protein [Archaeoglobus sp.]
MVLEVSEEVIKEILREHRLIASKYKKLLLGKLIEMPLKGELPTSVEHLINILEVRRLRLINTLDLFVRSGICILRDNKVQLSEDVIDKLRYYLEE